MNPKDCVENHNLIRARVLMHNPNVSSPGQGHSGHVFAPRSWDASVHVDLSHLGLWREEVGLVDDSPRQPVVTL
jgi:hypothetical protein